MKIRCSLCGKKYELTHNGDQCPECGQRNYSKDAPRGVIEGPASQSAVGGDLDDRVAERYASVETHMNFHADTHSNLHKQYDGDGHHVSTPKSFSPHYTVNEDNTSHTNRPSANQKPRTCAYYIVMVMLIQIIAVFFMVSGGIKSSIKDSYDKNSVYNIDTVEHELDDEYNYYYLDLFDYTFAIGCMEDNYDEELMTWDIPEGYEVSIYIFEYFVEEDDYYGFYEEGDLTEIYAVTKDGRYIQPLASYEAEELVVDDPFDSMDFVVSDLGYQYGYLCFLVEEDDIDHIIIDEYSGEADDRVFEVRHELK